MQRRRGRKLITRAMDLLGSRCLIGGKSALIELSHLHFGALKQMHTRIRRRLRHSMSMEMKQGYWCVPGAPLPGTRVLVYVSAEDWVRLGLDGLVVSQPVG